MVDQMYQLYEFELAMELVRLNLIQIQNEIKNIYEAETHNYRKLDKLKKETDELLTRVTPCTEEQDLIHSELRFKLIQMISEYHDIYYALN